MTTHEHLSRIYAKIRGLPFTDSPHNDSVRPCLAYWPYCGGCADLMTDHHERRFTWDTFDDLAELEALVVADPIRAYKYGREIIDGLADDYPCRVATAPVEIRQAAILAACEGMEI